MMSRRRTGALLVLLVLPPIAGAFAFYLITGLGGESWTIPLLRPAAAGSTFSAIRIVPAAVLAFLALLHVAVVLPSVWLTRGGSAVRWWTGAAVVGAATLGFSFLLNDSGPSRPAAALVVALVYAGLPVAVLWIAASATIGRRPNTA